MNKYLTNLLKKVFLSSLTGLIGRETNALEANDLVLEFRGSLIEINSKSTAEPNSTPKLILKKTNNQEWSLLSHRSHRSHQSHRSHYSSQGSGHISHFSHYSSSTGSSSTNPATNGSNYPNYNQNNSQKPKNYSYLGARNLSKGKSGADVTELINILLRKGYLKSTDGSTYVFGEYVYDETIEDAVMRFQRDNGLTPDGICGASTVYYLKNK